MKFRSRIVEIDAVQWTGDLAVLIAFCGQSWSRARAQDVQWLGKSDPHEIVLWNVLEEQWLCCPMGHWIIRGLSGEFYPCAPEVFARKYEAI